MGTTTPSPLTRETLRQARDYDDEATYYGRRAGLTTDPGRVSEWTWATEWWARQAGQRLGQAYALHDAEVAS